MKKLILLLVLFSTAHVMQAQTSKVINQATQQNLNELASPGSLGVVQTFDNRYAGVRGTPFFNEHWGTATITLNNTVFENIQAKFNVFENVLLYNDKGKPFILDLNRVDSFVLKDTLGMHAYSFKRVSNIADIDPKLNNKFAHVIFEGSKTKLFKIPSKEFIKANYKGAYSTGDEFDKFSDDNLIYFVNNAGEAEKIKLNKRTLVNSLKDKKVEIEKFISQEKIKTETEDGWNRVLTYYDSL